MNLGNNDCLLDILFVVQWAIEVAIISLVIIIHLQKQLYPKFQSQNQGEWFIRALFYSKNSWDTIIGNLSIWSRRTDDSGLSQTVLMTSYGRSRHQLEVFYDVADVLTKCCQGDRRPVAQTAVAQGAFLTLPATFHSISKLCKTSEKPPLNS